MSVCALTVEAIPEVCESVCALTRAFTDEDAFCTSVSVASEPLERPAPVSVLTPFVQTSAASVPKLDKVRPVKFQIAVGSMANKDDEAFPTTRLVLLFTLVVCAEATDASDEVAFCTSESVASDPELKPAPVSVRVGAYAPFHISAASEPNAVSVRPV